MARIEKNTDERKNAPESISVLLITAQAEDLGSVREIVGETCSVALATRCCDATEDMASRRPDVVLCDRELPDGDWKTILFRLQSLNPEPLLIVACRHANEGLWAEVLNLGGYDVLLKPYERMEVARVIAMASRYRRVSNGKRPARETISRGAAGTVSSGL